MLNQATDSVLLLFCKAPVKGQVKTRLQPQLTAEQATDVHRELTLMTLQRAVEFSSCDVVLYCAPDPLHPFFTACAQRYSIKLATQKGNDLGERMHQAFIENLQQYRYVLLMGCDCPSLTKAELEQALQGLKGNHDVVLAPAEDGGYVMIGLKQAQPQLFKNMRWSHDQVMSETLERSKQSGLHVLKLAQQWDVDRFEDWQRYRNSTSDLSVSV